MPLMSGHRPDLAMAPGRMLPSQIGYHLPEPVPRRPRPRPRRETDGTGSGLFATPGPFRDVEQPAEPRGRHPRLSADYLEVLEGPSRPSALFFQTRSSTCASPSAWVNSTTSVSSCSSRLEGPDRPATSAVLPASMNSAFQRPIDCSETFSFRAASAIDISPAKIASTIRVFFSGGIVGGRPNA